MRLPVHRQQRLRYETPVANITHVRSFSAVHCSDMQRQRSPLRIPLITKLTSVRFFFRVDVDVHRQVVLLRESLPAETTSERFFSRVRLLVIFQTGNRRHLFTASLAQMSLALVIDGDVHLQVLPRGKRLITELANVRFLFGVGPLVIREVLLLPETLVALITRERPLVVVNHLMIPQTLLRRHFPPASFAYVPLALPFVARRYVSLQVVLDGVHLVANVATVTRLDEILLVFLLVSLQTARIAERFLAHLARVPHPFVDQRMFPERRPRREHFFTLRTHHPFGVLVSPSVLLQLLVRLQVFFARVAVVVFLVGMYLRVFVQVPLVLEQFAANRTTQSFWSVNVFAVFAQRFVRGKFQVTNFTQVLAFSPLFIVRHRFFLILNFYIIITAPESRSVS